MVIKVFIFFMLVLSTHHVVLHCFNGIVIKTTEILIRVVRLVERGCSEDSCGVHEKMIIVVSIDYGNYRTGWFIFSRAFD